MKIGDYVKYDNDLWEIINIEISISGKIYYYQLDCKTSNKSEIWVNSKLVEETDISQLLLDI